MNIYTSLPVDLNYYPVNYNEDIEALQAEESPDAVFTDGYQLNAGIGAATIAAQAVANRLLNNNNFNSGVNSSTRFIADMAFANFAEKIGQGNWMAVDSVKKQAIALLFLVGTAAASDALAYSIPVQGSTQTFPLGQATLFAAINAAGYAAAMCSAAILNKRTYTRGAEVATQNTTAENINVRRALSGSLVSAVALAAASINRFIDGNTPVGVVLNMAKSEVLNRLFITGRKTEDELANKIKLLAFYWLLGIGADVLMGAVLPSQFDRMSPWRYFTGTSIGATLSFCRITANVFLDHHREQQAAGNGQASRSRSWKLIGAAALSVAIPALAVGAYHLGLVNSSPTLSLGVKMVQNTLASLVTRELHKSFSGFFTQVAISTFPAAIATGVELLSNVIHPINSTLQVTGVAVGCAAKYLGLTVRKNLVGNERGEE